MLSADIFIATGVLFVLFVGVSMFAYAAASAAWAIVRRRHAGSGAPVLDWVPNEQEGSLQSGAAFFRFFFLGAHRTLRDREIDTLCSRVRWGTLIQLAVGAAILYLLGRA